MKEERRAELRKLADEKRGSKGYVEIAAKELCWLVENVNKAALDPEQLAALQQSAGHNQDNAGQIVLLASDFCQLVDGAPAAAKHADGGKKAGDIKTPATS